MAMKAAALFIFLFFSSSAILLPGAASGSEVAFGPPAAAASATAFLQQHRRSRRSSTYDGKAAAAFFYGGGGGGGGNSNNRGSSSSRGRNGRIRRPNRGGLGAGGGGEATAGGASASASAGSGHPYTSDEGALTSALDRWILTGSAAAQERAYETLEKIRRRGLEFNSSDGGGNSDDVVVEGDEDDPEEPYRRAVRLARRAGLPVQNQPEPSGSASRTTISSPPVGGGGVENSNISNSREKFQKNSLQEHQRDDEGGDAAAGESDSEDSNSNKKELGRTDNDLRRRGEADARKEWEASRQKEGDDGQQKQKRKQNQPRSALGRRQASGDGNEVSKKPDLFMGQIDDRLQKAADDKNSLEREMCGGGNGKSPLAEDISLRMPFASSSEADDAAASKVSQYIALAGAGTAFEGTSMGIGGLDDVLKQVKRRVWIPLAAPPRLLGELGIRPVRGLLLYGRPGCGKTLLASKLGQLLSPLRPVTVVSGPQVMDKFVGSSEKNLREIFDEPPDIYDYYRLNQPSDVGDVLARNALHVIVMDEFDAIARARGGRGGAGGDQGDAGVARDSVVNQLLAKMDGADPLAVPTLVIGLTNKRSLIEPALLRPGRFEVQIEVPPPRTTEARISILQVHTRHMHEAGRLLVKDAPAGSAAAHRASWNDELKTYGGLLNWLADECDGFSGASIAAVCRAAASHALERSVTEFTSHLDDFVSAEGDSAATLLHDCVVTEGDFEEALKDVIESQGDSDWSEDEEGDDADGKEWAGEADDKKDAHDDSEDKQ